MASSTGGSEQPRPAPPPATDLQVAKARQELLEEFEQAHPGPTIERVFEESLAQFGDAAVPGYVATLGKRLARDRLRALGQVEGTIKREGPEVVFVGLEARGRSQMATALTVIRSGGRVNAIAAGTHMTSELDPNVIAAMAEIGIDLTDSHPKPLSREVLDAADVVVTLGRSVGRVELPPGKRHEDWRVGDPVGASLEEIRRIRRELELRVDELVAGLLAAGNGD